MFDFLRIKKIPSIIGKTSHQELYYSRTGLYTIREVYKISCLIHPYNLVQIKKEVPQYNCHYH